jgi:polysaccharide lyase-like protein
VLREDDCSNPDPSSLWNPDGPFDIEGSGSTQHFSIGGPSNGPFRRISTQGKRWELGYNSHVLASDGSLRTFWLYREGDHAITEWWLRLAPDFPLSTYRWQVIAQMKQSGPSVASGGYPVPSFEAREGQIQVQHNGTDATPGLPRLPITAGIWTPIKIEATYSQDPAKGSVQLSVGNQTSAVAHFPTLKPEHAPPGDGGTLDPNLRPGESIPSHLRMGVYHDAALRGTYIDIAGIRVSD